MQHVCAKSAITKLNNFEITLKNRKQLISCRTVPFIKMWDVKHLNNENRTLNHLHDEN